MTKDTELEIWQQEWRSETEPLPDLKKKIKRQNLQTFVGAALLCACLAVSAYAALSIRSSFLKGMATGLWFSSLLLGSYAWRVRRGTWKPAAQTTQAYLELSYRRAAAKLRTLRAATYLVVVVTVPYAIFLAWKWFSSNPGTPSGEHLLGVAILLAIAAELGFFRWYGRRKKHEMEEAQKLLHQMTLPE